MNIKKLSEEIYNDEKIKSHRDFINNFEKHQPEVESIDYSSSQQNYDLYSRLIADYALALAMEKNYKKAIPYVDKALNLFQNNKKYTAETLPNLKFYEELLFNRGRCYYNLEKYELAKLDFDLLRKLYPDNSIYPKWTFAIRNIKWKRLINILWYVFAGSILIRYFIDVEKTVKYILLGIGVFAFITAAILEGVIYLGRKKNSI